MDDVLTLNETHAQVAGNGLPPVAAEPTTPEEAESPGLLAATGQVILAAGMLAWDYRWPILTAVSVGAGAYYGLRWLRPAVDEAAEAFTY